MCKKVSVITLTHNKLKETTIPFLQSLYANTDKSLFELIIFDNGSQDGTVEFLQEFSKKYDNVKVIYNNENSGYSKGCNEAANFAHCEYIAFLNNDILLSKNWLNEILCVFEKENNAGLVSSYPIEAFEYNERLFSKAIKRTQKRLKDDYKPVIFPDFSCVVTKKSLFDKIGRFDENFAPAYFEDDDLSWRYIFEGCKNFISNKSFIYHKGSLTANTIDNIKEIFEKNKKYFFQKYSDKYYVQCSWEAKSRLIELSRKIIKKRKKSLFYYLKNFIYTIT